MSFEVKRIVNGNTIEVSPNWKWGDKKGSLVMIQGYNIGPSSNDSFALKKLETLILNKPVELKNALSVSENVIQCSVYLNDVDISQYFPEFKTAS